jgi:hypothetical protein
MRASRARQREAPKNSRRDLIGKALRASPILLGTIGKSGKRALIVPRSHVLAELNGFLGLPEPITAEELKAAMRANGWIVYAAGR